MLQKYKKLSDSVIVSLSFYHIIFQIPGNNPKILEQFYFQDAITRIFFLAWCFLFCTCNAYLIKKINWKLKNSLD